MIGEVRTQVEPIKASWHASHNLEVVALDAYKLIIARAFIERFPDGH